MVSEMLCAVWQAMDNSIGNMGKQLGSLISNHGQQSTNLQQSQQAPTIDAANSFQQVLPLPLPCTPRIFYCRLRLLEAKYPCLRRISAAGLQPSG